MKKIGRSVVAIVALAASSAVGAARPAPSAERVIAAAKLASGGAAWDAARGCAEEGTRADGAVPYRTWFSLRHYGIRIESQRGDSTQAIGFNGTVSWQKKGSGRADVRTDGEAVKEAVVTAYLSNNGFFFPKRFPASFAYVRQAADRDRQFDVIEITPVGGRSLEVWFDRATHLIGRVVDGHGPQAVTVEAEDYRRVGKVTIAFGLRVVGPDGTVLDKGRVTSFRCGAIDEALFDPPA